MLTDAKLPATFFSLEKYLKFNTHGQKEKETKRKKKSTNNIFQIPFTSFIDLPPELGSFIKFFFFCFAQVCPSSLHNTIVLMLTLLHLNTFITLGIQSHLINQQLLLLTKKKKEKKKYQLTM